MLFLLTDDQGRALMMAQADTQAEADRFGRSHIPEFCGESVEIEDSSRAEAEEFWAVRTVRVAGMALATDQAKISPEKVTFTMTQVWVRGPVLPEEVEADDLLTPEDNAAITLDHIARTCEFVAHIEIRKRA